MDGTAHLLHRCSAALVSVLGHDKSTAKEIAVGKAEELVGQLRHVRHAPFTLMYEIITL